jgi:hypothetical protein
MENSRNEQFTNFTFYTFLSSVMKYHTILLCPAQDVNHPSVQYFHPVNATCLCVTLGYQID